MAFRTFSWSAVLEAFRVLIPYTGMTLLILVSALLIGLLLGFLICQMLLSGRLILRVMANLYLTAVRGAPAVVLLFLVYYGLPGLLSFFGGAIGEPARLVSVIMTFALIAAGQMAYVLYGAYRAIPSGQIEAAAAVGYSRSRTFFSVLVPQGLTHALPNFVNTTTALLKEGAVAYTIGLVDVVGRAKLLIASHYGGQAAETYLSLTIIFFVLIRLIEFSARLLEKKGFRHLRHSTEHTHV